MKRFPKQLLIPLLLLAAILLVACSTTAAPDESNAPPPGPISFTTARTGPTMQAGKLVVGTSADYAPFSYITSDFRLDGFDIAVMREIAQRMGMELEFRDFAFDGLGGALQLGQIDAAIAAISFTPERARQVDFSDIYYVGEDGVLASEQSGITELPTLDEIGQYRVGVQSGSVYDDWAQNNLVAAGYLPADQLFTYANTDAMVNDLANDRIDLAIMDLIPAKEYAKKGAARLNLQDGNGVTLMSFVPGPAVSIEDTEWLLAGYESASGGMVGAVLGSGASTRFSGGDVSGSTGCNDFNGSYEIDGEMLSISELASTRKFCETPPGVMGQESQVLDLLPQVASYQIKQTTLELSDADGTVILTYFARPTFADLGSITWQLVSFGPIADQQEPAPDSEITLNINDEGQVSGSSGCNTYSGGIDGQAEAFTIGPLASTQKLCADEAVNQQEAAYLQALGSANSATLRGNSLLVGYGDEEVLTFMPVANDPLAGTAWALDSFAATGRVVEPAPTLSFTYGSNAFGSTGCNQYNGSYEADDALLLFGPMSMTRSVCADEAGNTQESAYMVALVATRHYELLGVNLIGQGLSQQDFVIAVAKGNTELRQAINKALAEMVAEGRMLELIEQYLGLDKEDIIPPPQPPIEPACIDGMAWIADLTYDDKNMQSVPTLKPGESFNKGWRIRNTGTCTWDSSYVLRYDGGNTNASQMGGQPTAIQGTVAPGGVYDLYVAMIAPQKPDTYVGYWNLTNGENVAFGERLYVAITVAAPPTPTQTPSPQVNYWADRTEIRQGECTTVHWDVKNVKSVYFYEEGQDWQNHGVAGQGEQTVCPPRTTIYNLRIVFNDGAVQVLPMTISVIPAPGAPEIDRFSVTPVNINLGECVTVAWAVSGPTDQVRITRDGTTLWKNAPLTGNMPDCPPNAGIAQYAVEAKGPGGNSRSVQSVNVLSPVPTNTAVPPTNTAVPPTNTPVPPTSTSIPPTNTLVPPTNTPVSPTDTPVPPTPTTEPTTPPPGSDLLGDWDLVSLYQGRAAPLPPLPGTAINIEFRADGTLTGASGCNTYNGGYTVGAGNILSISPLAISQQICTEPEGVMEQEQAYLLLLQNASSYQVNNGRLLIEGVSGGLNYQR
ncbi:MAG: META domain-containing protein [Caldilineales bacterium]|nr:META domain-containing protein [Caldilineales bacterium]